MRPLLLFLFVFTVLTAFGQSNDAALNKRLNEYLAANRRLDFETLMDYIYPKLFKIAPREAIIGSFQRAFNNDEVQLKIDSMEVVRVGPVFAYGTSAYRKADYTMTLNLSLTDKAQLSDTAVVQLMEKNFAKTFRGTATHDKAAETFRIRASQFMLAVKEQGQPWMFVGHKPDKSLNEFLFPQAVIKRFDLLKE